MGIIVILKKDFKYFGLQNGDGCYCGNDDSKFVPVAPEECDHPCSGDENEICGASWRLSVYGPKTITDFLTNGYSYAENSWGNLYYKNYGVSDFLSAKAQCESDGAYLPTPKSDAMNAFIAGLSSVQLWLGINDLAQEGVWKTTDGQDLSYTNWLPGQPNHAHIIDGIFYSAFLSKQDHIKGKWNDAPLTNAYEFVCIYEV